MIPDHPAHQAQPPKFCKDCIHCKPHPYSEGAAPICWRVEAGVDLVTGRLDYSLAWCSFQREHGACGQSARFFEPKADDMVATLRAEGGL